LLLRETKEEELMEMTEGGFGFHRAWGSGIRGIKRLDIGKIKRRWALSNALSIKRGCRRGFLNQFLRGCTSFPVSVAIVLSFILGGCSSIAVTHHAVGDGPPPYKAKDSKEKIVVYWGTAWRTNQKEPSKREAIAAKGIAEFFESTPRFETLFISKSIAGRDALLATDAEAVSEAQTAGADRVVIIRIEELTPNLMFCLLPVVWRTENEVSLHVRSIHCGTSRVDADVSTRWTRGGLFTLQGAKSLPVDFEGALKAVFFGKDAE
jgi:hypothetical protein